MRTVLFLLFILPSLSHDRAGQFQDDIKQLSVFKTALDDMFGEMLHQKRTTARHEKGYISSVEHNRIENLLFRFLVCRNSVWEIIHRYRNYQDDPQANMKAFVIGYNAALTLYRYSGILVTTYMEDEQIVDKLNESYYRVGIPVGTFTRIFDSLTDPENLKDLDVARELFLQELRIEGTPLNALLSNPDFSPLLDELDTLHEIHLGLRSRILSHYVLLTPELTNALRHSEIQKRAEKLIEKFGSRYQTLKAIAFTEVGDLKDPASRGIHFSESQKMRIFSLLKPGDIILTYSEGYMSNIFLPGTFKHGIVFTGKRNAELPNIELTDTQESMINPEDDIVEAVSEGVVSGPISRILDGQINRLVILRLLHDSVQVSGAVRTAYSFLGNNYDFSFDFNDASSQVCTELIYRSYNGLGHIQFDLKKRAGVMTLSADDVARFALNSGETEFILVAVEDEKHPGEAVLLTGHDGVSALHEMVN